MMFRRIFNNHDDISAQPIISDISVRDGETPKYVKLLEYTSIKSEYWEYKKPVVGIIDSGIYPHSDLVDDIRSNHNFASDSIQGDHGTHVAGIVTGAPHSLTEHIPLYNYKALKASGGGSFDDVVSAIRQAIDDKIEVINLSLGAQKSNREIERALSEFCQNPRHFAIIATGNDHRNGGQNTSDFPAWLAKDYPNIIAVGSANIISKNRAVVSQFSSRGVVTLCGQGEQVLSTIPQNDYAYMSGTSMAAPLVSACIAYAKAILPDFNCFDFKELAQISCLDMDKKGHDNATGHGFLIPKTFLSNVEKMKSGNLGRGIQEDIPQCKSNFIARLLASIIGLFK